MFLLSASATSVLRLQLCKSHFRQVGASILNRSQLGGTSARTILTCSPKPYRYLQPLRTGQRWQPVRQVYIDFQNKNRFVFDPVMAIIIAAAVAYFTQKAIYVEAYVNAVYTFKDQDGKPVPFTKKLLEEVYTILDDSKIYPNYKTMDLPQFVFSTNLEPFILSGFFSRYGVFFGLPIYLNYSFEETDIDQFLTHFGLVKETLAASTDADGKTALEQLQQCFSLSPAARRYLVLSMLNTASTPVDPILNTAALAFAPLGAYTLSMKVMPKASGPVLAGCLFGGYLLAGASMFIMQYVQQRYGSWATFHYESGDSDADRDELYNGAREFLQKLEQLQEIVAKYSSNSSKRSARRSWLDSYKSYTVKRRLADLEKFARKDSSIIGIFT